MAVVPIVTLIPVATMARTPVRNKRRIVATWLPLPSLVVTLNGSPMQVVLGVFGLVTLQTLARPPAPFVLVKMSGCALTITSTPRITVPLLLMTIGYVPAPK